MSEESKVIVITGVTKGLGKAMACYFLSNGHTVIGCGRSADLLKSLREEFDVCADRCHLSVVDVTDDEQVKSWSIEALKYGSPDVVINNAATSHPYMPIWEESLQNFNLVIDARVKGYASVMRYFLPRMINSGRGVLINISSVAGRHPWVNMASYTAAIYAVEGMSKAVSLELPEPLTSVTLDPGVVKTSATDRVFPGEVRLTSANVWAEKVCPFILTIDRSMNGQTIVVSEVLGIHCGCIIKDREFLIEGIDY